VHMYLEGLVEVGQDLAKEHTKSGFHEPVGCANVYLQLKQNFKFGIFCSCDCKYGCLEYLLP
jgi:hypothetical protein